jgi:hypothetical protein
VQHDRVALGDAVEDPERPAAGVQEVLGDHLEPVHLGPLPEDVAEMDGPEADADAEIGKVEAITHARSFP